MPKAPKGEKRPAVVIGQWTGSGVRSAVMSRTFCSL